MNKDTKTTAATKKTGSSETVLRLVARGPPTGNGQPKTGKLKD